jgi:hypothetical protein
MVLLCYRVQVGNRDTALAFLTSAKTQVPFRGKEVAYGRCPCVLFIATAQTNCSHLPDVDFIRYLTRAYREQTRYDWPSAPLATVSA